VCHVYELNTFSSFHYFLPQQTSDNTENVKDIERRVQSLYGVLASPASEDDFAEKARRVELRRFVFIQMHINLLIPLSGGLMVLLQSSNHSLRNTRFSNSYGTLITPKP